MPTGTHSPVSVALGSATTGTEEGRAFLQDRLRLYAGWVFVFAFGFYLLNILIYTPRDDRVRLAQND